jgi:hypothetical protein
MELISLRGLVPQFIPLKPVLFLVLGTPTLLVTVCRMESGFLYNTTTALQHSMRTSLPSKHTLEQKLALEKKLGFQVILGTVQVRTYTLPCMPLIL